VNKEAPVGSPGPDAGVTDMTRRRGRSTSIAILLGAAIGLVASPAMAAAPPSPPSLICRSDGSGDQMAIATRPLPAGFTRVTGKVRRPLLRNGPFLLRIVLANDSGPPTHAAGLMSTPIPAPMSPRPITGYPLSLFASADNKKFWREELGWLIVADEFALSFSLDQPGRLEARLDWQSPSGAHSQALSVPIARDDLKHLTIACWNGDFELYDLSVSGRRPAAGRRRR